MMRRVSLLCSLSLALSAGSGSAAPPIAIVGATVQPVVGPPIPDGLVLIQGERIEYVGAKKPLPAGAEVIDGAGRIVTPGFIDLVTQLGSVEVSMAYTTRDHELETSEPVRAALYLGDLIDLRSTLVGVARRHGVTAALSVPTGGLVSGRSAFVELAEPSATLTARSLVQGPMAVHVHLGALGAKAVGGSRAEAFRRLTELLEDARLLERNRAAFERNAYRALAVHRLHLEAMIPIAQGKQPLFASVSRASDILALVALAERERIRVVVVGGEEAWLVAKELAESKTPVVVHPLDNLPADFESRSARQDSAARLAAAGVPIVVSTFSSHNAGGLRFVLGNAVRAGLPADVALRSATRAPAEVLGLENQVGSLKAGLRANLVVWTGDPFEPSSHAERVMIRGVFQSTENRQTRLRARHQARLGLGGPPK